MVDDYQVNQESKPIDFWTTTKKDTYLQKSFPREESHSGARRLGSNGPASYGGGLGYRCPIGFPETPRVTTVTPPCCEVSSSRAA